MRLCKQNKYWTYEWPWFAVYIPLCIALSAYDFYSNRIQKSGGFCLTTLDPFRCNGQACTGFGAPLNVIYLRQKNRCHTISELMAFYLCLLTDELLDDRPVSCQVLGNLWPFSQQIDNYFFSESYYSCILLHFVTLVKELIGNWDGDMVEFLTHLRCFHIQIVFFLCAKEKAKVR